MYWKVASWSKHVYNTVILSSHWSCIVQKQMMGGTETPFSQTLCQSVLIISQLHFSPPSNMQIIHPLSGETLSSLQCWSCFSLSRGFVRNREMIWRISSPTGKAAKLLSPIDSRNILTAVCHRPVTLERWMLERQPCQPLKHLTMHLRGVCVPVSVRSCWFSASRYSALFPPKRNQSACCHAARLCCNNQVLISTRSDCN